MGSLPHDLLIVTHRRSFNVERVTSFRALHLLDLCLYVSRQFGSSSDDVPACQALGSKSGHVMMLTLGEVVYQITLGHPC